MRKRKIKISVVIPVFNEAKSVRPLYQELAAVLRKIRQEYEIIFVDDGSTDETFRQIQRLHSLNKKMARNKKRDSWRCLLFVQPAGVQAMKL